MTKAEIMQVTQGLAQNKKMTAAEKETIAKLYAVVFGRQFVRRRCSDCYRDAAIEMYTYLNKGGVLAEDKHYRLRAGKLLHKFGSNEFLGNNNITDELAREYLRMCPDWIKWFEIHPKNWEEEVFGKTEPEPEPVAEAEEVAEVKEAAVEPQPEPKPKKKKENKKKKK